MCSICFTFQYFWPRRSRCRRGGVHQLAQHGPCRTVGPRVLHSRKQELETGDANTAPFQHRLCHSTKSSCVNVWLKVGFSADPVLHHVRLYERWTCRWLQMCFYWAISLELGASVYMNLWKCIQRISPQCVCCFFLFVCFFLPGSHAGSFRNPTCSNGGRGGPGEPGGGDGSGWKTWCSHQIRPKQNPQCGQDRHPQVPL